MPPVLTSGALRGSERAVIVSSSLPVTPPTTAMGVALHQDGQLHVTSDGKQHDYKACVMLAFCQATISCHRQC